MAEHPAEAEDLEEFRPRARAFVRANLPPWTRGQSIGTCGATCTDEEELVAVARDRELQRMLFDAGFAGICFPSEYGGQGLTPEHQRALTRSWPATSTRPGSRSRPSRPAPPSCSTSAPRSRSAGTCRPS